MFLAQNWNATVLDEFVGPANPYHRRMNSLRIQMLHHRAAKTVVQNVVFNGTNDFDATSKKFERPGVERLDPARVDERDRNSFFLQLPGGFLGDFEHVAESENRDVSSMPHHLGFSDLE